MIGRLTETAIAASELALAYEQLAWPRDSESFAGLRAELLDLLGQLELDVDVPLTQEAFLEERPMIGGAITRTLSAERGGILGDTIALPAFFLVSFALRAAINVSFGTPDTGERDLAQDCLEDLGLDRDLITVLDREAGWISVISADGEAEPTVRHADIIRAGGSFFVRVLEEFERTEGDMPALAGQLQALRATVEDFRAEQREANERLEQLVRDGDENLLGVLKQVEAAMVEQGWKPQAAQQLVEDDPRSLWDRVLRWLGGSGPRDVAEAALWAALDFVPGGTGVKLGLKVAEAVRKATKKPSKQD